jgi:hypothetical protein
MTNAAAKQIIYELMEVSADSAVVSSAGGPAEKLNEVERRTDRAILNAWKALTGRDLIVLDPVGFIYTEDK